MNYWDLSQECKDGSMNKDQTNIHHINSIKKNKTKHVIMSTDAEKAFNR